MSSLPVFDTKTGDLRYVLEFSHALLGKGIVVPYFDGERRGEIVFPFTCFSTAGMDGSITVCLADEEMLSWLDAWHTHDARIHRVGDAHEAEAQP